jgi:hypothetical protein
MTPQPRPASDAAEMMGVERLVPTGGGAHPRRER